MQALALPPGFVATGEIGDPKTGIPAFSPRAPMPPMWSRSRRVTPLQSVFRLPEILSIGDLQVVCELKSPVGGATGVLYARRSVDGNSRRLLILRQKVDGIQIHQAARLIRVSKPDYQIMSTFCRHEINCSFVKLFPLAVHFDLC